MELQYYYINILINIAINKLGWVMSINVCMPVTYYYLHSQPIYTILSFSADPSSKCYLSHNSTTQ